MMRDEQFVEFVTIDEQTTRMSLTGWKRRLDALAVFFPDGLAAGAALEDRGMRLDALSLMAKALQHHGFPGRALIVHSQHDELCREFGAAQATRLASALAVHAESLRLCGRFHDADIVAREGLDLQGRVGKRFSIGVDMFAFGRGLRMRGEHTESSAALDEALNLLASGDRSHEQTFARWCGAQRAVWDQDWDTVERTLDTINSTDTSAMPTLEDADEVRAQTILSRLTQLAGETAMAVGHADRAGALFQQALSEADGVHFVEGTIHAMLGLHSVAALQGDLDNRRRWLDAIFQLVHQGPYRVLDSDAHLALAALESEQGNPAIATSAARRAATLSWCDGPPFSYASGYQRAEASLRMMHGPEPITNSGGNHQF